MPGTPIGREPFFSQPNMRLKANAASIQFAIKAFDVRFKKRSLDFQRKIANAQVEQLLISQFIPRKTVAASVARARPAAHSATSSAAGDSEIGLCGQKYPWKPGLAPDLMTTVIPRGREITLRVRMNRRGHCSGVVLDALAGIKCLARHQFSEMMKDNVVQ